MAQPVWVLSVDLQTKTATFQTGLADAAKSARGAFQEIKSGAAEMGGETGYSMMEARHSVMLLGEEFGIHLPRAVAGFIASIGPLGAALEAAFPFLAIAAGATILIEHLNKMHEAGEKLTDDQVKFGTAVQVAFNSLDQKLIQSQIKADELKNDHLGALRLQLELIDKQSMGELVHQFGELAKAADVVMKDLEGSWYSFGRGSEGAKHALDGFKAEYESLLAQGKQGDASGLLKGTLDQAQKALDAMRQMQTAGRSNPFAAFADPAKFHEAADALERMHIAVNPEHLDKQIAAQENLVQVLNAQASSEQRIADIKNLDKGNAKTQVGNDEAGKRAAAERQAAESQMRMGEQTLAADKATAESRLSINRASLEERLSTDIEFAGRDRDIKLGANQAEISALDKSGKDYANQLKALQDKTLEINNEYATKVAELKAKEATEANSRDLRDLEQSEREKIEATRDGSAARLAAIDAAIKEERSMRLQDNGYFHDLLNQHAEFVTKAMEEEGKLKADAARQQADSDQKTGELQIASEKQLQALLDSSRRTTAQQRATEEAAAANAEYRIKMDALEKEISGLDKAGKDYTNKLQGLLDKERQLQLEHENAITSIKEKAEIERNQRVLAAESQFENSIASNLTRSIMGHQTWTKMMLSLGDEAVSGMIKNSLLILMQQDKERLGDAKTAAGNAYAAVSSIPIVGPALAPVAAAGAFAAVMAFETGTDRVPGVGRGDIVPTMLEPGEGVVPGGVMDNLRAMSRNGGFDQRPATHVHTHVTYHVQTIDGDGMQRALEKHNDQLARHVESAVRRMNK